MKWLIIFTILLTSVSVFSQQNTNDNALQTAIKVKSLQEKKIDYHKKTGFESDGYRIKIHFSADKTQAREVQAKFNAKYPEITSYEEYQQPNFVINVGDFKTKLEAYEQLKKIKEEYPYAFIVKSKIKPMKLN